MEYFETQDASRKYLMVTSTEALGSELDSNWLSVGLLAR